jgi:hypothetical protein
MTAPSLESAACTAHPGVMDGSTRGDVIRGLYFCAECPVLVQCRAWANSCRRGILTGAVAGKVWGEAKRWIRND